MISGSTKSYADTSVAEPVGYAIDYQSKSGWGAGQLSSLALAQYAIEGRGQTSHGAGPAAARLLLYDGNDAAKNDFADVSYWWRHLLHIASTDVVFHLMYFLSN